MDEILSTMFIIGASQGFFLFLALTFNKRNCSENRILAFLVMLIAVDLLIGFYYKKSDVLLHEASLIGYSIDFFGYSLIFIYGPVINLYAKRMTLGSKRIRLSHSLHLLPFLLTASYSIFLYLFSRGDRSRELYIYLYDTWDYADFFITLLMIVSIASYFVPTYLYLKKYSNRVKNFYSNTRKITLLWLRAFILLFLVYTSLLFVFMIMMIDSKLGQFVYSDLYYIFMSLSIFLLGYFAMAQPGIFDKIELMEQGLQIVHKKERTKYKKTKLEDKQSDEYLETIISHVTDTGSFTNPDMNLKQLAESLGIAPHHVSQVINSKLDKNFYQFINHYRVEAVKGALADPARSHISILEIAFEAGFNTKSTFNAIFKQSTGMTPSQYRKSRL